MNYTQNNKISQVSEKTFVVGVDIGSETNYARAFNWRGLELSKKVFRFSNSQEGFQSFLAYLNTYKTIASAEQVIGDESISILANDGYIDLNCETHNAYDAQGFCNGYVKSDDFPALKTGKNYIAWSGAVEKVEITPRWWTL